ncbi:PilZ domain-containing protein [Bacterioplanes sanyensis]|uniref:PilZ domain-containing protein n=1 Tax=Bacterioplanes sanyensis TaxID=1249553 RepID=A0A222FL25_9GAMM|nr:PilZ domain-containing protein [Bacterioplanes sanyensis]ASP39737.1 PilZ domain-containing protein [Bacterioplanes sanyensis]
MTTLTRTYQEKRDFMRMQIKTPASLRLSDGRDLQLTCLDLSSTGVQLACSEPLPIGATGTLYISSGGQATAPLTADITICRVEEDNDSYRLGATINDFK